MPTARSMIIPSIVPSVHFAASRALSLKSSLSVPDGGTGTGTGVETSRRAAWTGRPVARRQ